MKFHVIRDQILKSSSEFHDVRSERRRIEEWSEIMCDSKKSNIKFKFRIL